MDAAVAGLVGATIGAVVGLTGTVVDRVWSVRRANVEWLRQLQVPNYRSALAANDEFVASINDAGKEISSLLEAAANWIEHAPSTFPDEPPAAYVSLAQNLEQRVKAIADTAAHVRGEASGFSLVSGPVASLRLQEIVRLSAFWLDMAGQILSKVPGPPFAGQEGEPHATDKWVTDDPGGAAARFRDSAAAFRQGSSEIAEALAGMRSPLLDALRSDLGIGHVHLWQRRNRFRSAQADAAQVQRMVGDDRSNAAVPERRDVDTPSLPKES